MSPVGIAVFLAASGLVWHLLARGRHRENLAAHRAVRAGQARFWAARLRADDARSAGDPAAADARLRECARHLAAVRAQVADLPGAGVSGPAAAERLHAAQEELRRMQDSMLGGGLEPAERRRILEHVGRPGATIGTEAAAGAPARSPRPGEPDALERGIRFAFGFFFGVGLAFLLTLRKPLATDGANLLMLGVMGGVCGLMAVRFGDGFWFWISENLEWIWRWSRR